MPEPATEPLFCSLIDAANQCRDYAENGAPTTETLIEWAELFDSAASLAEWNERPPPLHIGD